MWKGVVTCLLFAFVLHIVLGSDLDLLGFKNSKKKTDAKVDLGFGESRPCSNSSRDTEPCKKLEAKKIIIAPLRCPEGQKPDRFGKCQKVYW